LSGAHPNDPSVHLAWPCCRDLVLFSPNEEKTASRVTFSGRLVWEDRRVVGRDEKRRGRPWPRWKADREAALLSEAAGFPFVVSLWFHKASLAGNAIRFKAFVPSPEIKVIPGIHSR
jgi:hypothetical protein